MDQASRAQEAARLKEAPDIKPRSLTTLTNRTCVPSKVLAHTSTKAWPEDIYPLGPDPIGLSAMAKQKSLDPYLMSQGVETSQRGTTLKRTRSV